MGGVVCVFFQAEDGIRDAQESRGLGDVYKRQALSIIMVHNHPGGDLMPSQEDLTLTRAVMEAGKLLDISLLDHLIVGRMRFISLKKEKYIS